MKKDKNEHAVGLNAIRWKGKSKEYKKKVYEMLKNARNKKRESLGKKAVK